MKSIAVYKTNCLVDGSTWKSYVMTQDLVGFDIDVDFKTNF